MLEREGWPRHSSRTFDDVLRASRAMSMCHKAYALSHSSFVAELGPVLYEALRTGRDAGLRCFIESNLSSLTFPWEGQPLPADWSSVLEYNDVHGVGDLALTKYYDAEGDAGLQEHWMTIEIGLSESARRCLLGPPFGPAGTLFDPGRMGSYFQSAEEAVRSRAALVGHEQPGLEPFLALLDEVVSSGKGLYVTF